MSKMKRIIALLMSLIIIFSSASPVAATTVSDNSTFNFGGITYKLEEKINDDGSKTVIVKGNDEINTITNNGVQLIVEQETINEENFSSYVIDINYDDNNDELLRASWDYTSKHSLYWNYFYNYDDVKVAPYGMWWYLSSGNANGEYSCYDNGNMTARDRAYDFCSNVRALDSAQWAAAAASGASAGSIATAIAAAVLSAGPTLGVGTIIGIVAAFLAGGVAIAEWVAAYNCSLNCNELFRRFKQDMEY